jgi:hypothetical protein
MLEIAERLENKQHGDTRFTQVQAPGGKTLLLLVCSDYGGTEGYRVHRCNLAWSSGLKVSSTLFTWKANFPVVFLWFSTFWR